jgi:hypothetical protein
MASAGGIPNGILMICLVDEDWNQLSDWRRTEYPEPVKFGKSKHSGIAVGYLIRHLPTNMVAFCRLDTRIRVAKLDSIELYIHMPTSLIEGEY